MDEIADTINIRKMLPVFVAEGTSSKKQAAINAVPYLRHCLDKLEDQTAPLFIFGCSINQNDKHIYERVFHGPTPEVYICVYGDALKFRAIREAIAPYLVASSAAIHYIDANQMNVWGVE